MVQYHQPKHLSVLPPILRRKLIIPDNPRELGSLVVIIGLAITLTCAWPNCHDLYKRIGKQQVKASLVAVVPYRANSQSRLVGVYLFKDETNRLVAVRGNRVYLKQAAIPHQARIVWKSGRSLEAQVVFEYLDYLVGLPIGLAVLTWGLFMRTTRRELIEAGMVCDLEDESASR
ncbi:hypothetical protein [Candidatus Phycosocius spiralis]|uniref:DUF3592 domain-containing protein n=1 Tax=Candidatus Phycosocius spiralis TaxID=2815099 RepID=A0ABQ4PT81_9PROT|nr:hypothetical protein [Candidatus Phycosocius spiralis]GIU66217.1 hypothetical protein PsB1_0371 [Candidatus Phycosocius spiralis]